MVQVPDPDRGYWQDYLSLLQGLSGDGFTTPEDLTRLLPDSAVTASGKNVRDMRFLHPIDKILFYLIVDSESNVVKYHI